MKPRPTVFDRLMSACRALVEDDPFDVEDCVDTEVRDSGSGVRLRESLTPPTHRQPHEPWWDEVEVLPAREFVPLAEGEWESDEALDTQPSVYDSTGVQRPLRPLMVEVVDVG